MPLRRRTAERLGNPLRRLTANEVQHDLAPQTKIGVPGGHRPGTDLLTHRPRATPPRRLHFLTYLGNSRQELLSLICLRNAASVWEFLFYLFLPGSRKFI